mmetsp:Transcript_116244/g.237722  ORF Transcript_116244/g.237722 Transcript_116244/m.237722 type:complete len:351 (-) Transcript_116244:610-1662(-)
MPPQREESGPCDDQAVPPSKADGQTNDNTDGSPPASSYWEAPKEASLQGKTLSTLDMSLLESNNPEETKGKKDQYWEDTTEKKPRGKDPEHPRHDHAGSQQPRGKARKEGQLLGSNPGGVSEGKDPEHPVDVHAGFEQPRGKERKKQFLLGGTPGKKTRGENPQHDRHGDARNQHQHRWYLRRGTLLLGRRSHRQVARGKDAQQARHGRHGQAAHRRGRQEAAVLRRGTALLGLEGEGHQKDAEQNISRQPPQGQCGRCRLGRRRPRPRRMQWQQQRQPGGSPRGGLRQADHKEETQAPRLVEKVLPEAFHEHPGSARREQRKRTQASRETNFYVEECPRRKWWKPGFHQ